MKDSDKRKIEFTDNVIKNLKYAGDGTKPDTYLDTKCTGLQLDISPKGVKTFFHRARFGNTQPRYKLNHYPVLKLAEARVTVLEHRIQMAKGETPHLKKAAPVSADTSGVPVDRWTLEQLTKAYIAKKSAKWKVNSGTGTDIENRFINHVYPIIPPHTRASAITMKQIVNMLAVVVKHSPSLFKKISHDIRAVINHMDVADVELRGKVLHINERELANRFAEETANHTEVQHHYVPVNDAPAFYAYFRDRMENSRQGRNVSFEALLFIVLTAARYGEVLGHRPTPTKPKRHKWPMRWKDIDWERRAWIVGGARMKGGFDHIVPLSGAAMALLQRVKLKTQRTAPEDFVFYNPTKGQDGWYSNGALKELLKTGPEYPNVIERKNQDTEIVIKAPTPHGMRTTFNIFGRKAGYPNDWVSLSISHKMKDAKKDSSFDSYWGSKLVEERRPLMEAWADYCTKGITPADWKPDFDIMTANHRK